MRGVLPGLGGPLGRIVLSQRTRAPWALSCGTRPVFGNWPPRRRPGGASFDSDDATECELFCCVGSSTGLEETAGSSRCYHQDISQTCGVEEDATATQRYLSSASSVLVSTVDTVITAILADHAGLVFASEEEKAAQILARTEFPPLLLQLWETGASLGSSTTAVTFSLNRSVLSASCGRRSLCFCRMDACPLTTDWTDPSVLIDIDGDARKLEENAAFAVPCRPLVVEARRLQWSVASKSQVDVDVVFGLVVRDTGRRLLGVRTLDNSWGWDANHEPYDPSAQRSMLSFCNSVPEELRIVTRLCWIEDFSNYLTRIGRSSPPSAASSKRSFRSSRRASSSTTRARRSSCGSRAVS